MIIFRRISMPTTVATRRRLTLKLARSSTANCPSERYGWFGHGPKHIATSCERIGSLPDGRRRSSRSRRWIKEHIMIRVKNVEPLDGNTVRVTFTNDEQRDIDVTR